MHAHIPCLDCRSLNRSCVLWCGGGCNEKMDGFVVHSNNKFYVIGGIGVYGSKTDMWSLDLTAAPTYPWTLVNATNPPAKDNGSPVFTGGKGAAINYWAETDQVVAAFGSP